MRRALGSPVFRSLAIGSSLSLIGVVAQAASRFGSNLIIGRVGGPASLGLIASALATAQLLCLCWPSALASAASRFLRESASNVEHLEVTTHVGRRAGQSCLLLSGAAGAWWLLSRAASPIDAAMVALAGLAVCSYTVGRGVQYGEGRVGRNAKLEVLLGLSSLTGVAILTAVGLRGLVLLLPMVMVYLAYAVVTWPTLRLSRASASVARRIDTYVALGTVGTLSSAGMAQAAVLMARHTAGVRGAGLFASASMLTTPVTLLLSALSLMALPMLAARRRVGEESMVRLIDALSRGIAVTMIPLVGVLSIQTPTLTHLVWGAQFAGSSVLLTLLLFAVLAGALAMPSFTALMLCEGRVMRKAVASGVLAAGVGIAAWLIVVPVLGLVGVAIGYLLASVTTSWLGITMASRRFSLRWRGFAVRTIIALGAAGSLAGAAAVLPEPNTLVTMLGSVAIVVICTVVYRREIAALIALARNSR